MNIQRKNSAHHFLVQSDRGGHLGANEPTVALKCFFLAPLVFLNYNDHYPML